MTLTQTAVDLPHLLEIAQQVVKEAASIARAARAGADSLVVETKSHPNDLVTQVDRQLEDFIAGRLATLTGLELLGEESHQQQSFAGQVWVLDPIDGTTNFVHTGRDYAISLALCTDGDPVLGVVLDVCREELYSAIAGQGAHCNGAVLAPVQPDLHLAEALILTDFKEIQALPKLAVAIESSRGHRRYGSAALECIEVAAGRAGAFAHLHVSPWDIAAATLICRECAVTVSRLDGSCLDIRAAGSILAAPPRLHGELLRRLR